MKSVIVKSFGLLVILFLSFSGIGKAQEKQSLLWSISGNGLAQDSYLFGTIHLICKDDFIMDDRILGAFEKSSQLILELDMDDPELEAKAQQLSINPEMANISDQIDETYRDDLDQFLIESYGAGLAQLGILKPFVLSSMVTVKQMPCGDAESYEMYFTKLAQEEEKEVLGLETMEFQMGVFDQIPMDYQLEELGKMVVSNEGKEEFKQMVAAYRSENLDELLKVMKGNEMMDTYQKLLLDDRNMNWVEGMKNHMNMMPTFFAVGSGHLPGEKGMINLLREAGYKVEPIQ